MTNDAITAALSRSDLFGGLDPRQQAQLARECHIRVFDKGRQIFGRGDTGDVMYVVGQGSTALSIGSADGAEVILAVMKLPQTFGELALIDHRARIATATAREATKLVIVPSTAVRALLRESPSLASAMLTALARLIRQMDDRAADLVLLDLPGRVASSSRPQPDPRCITSRPVKCGSTYRSIKPTSPTSSEDHDSK
jgi:CRP-like cAMP-binding protein